MYLWRKGFPILLLILIFFVSSGCGGGGGGTPGPEPTPPEDASISGFVVASIGGEPVVGASVKAVADDVTKSAITGAAGEYSFSLPQGKYRIECSKDGFAQSVLQDFSVTSGQTYTGVNLVQEQAFNADWQVASPSILITGIKDGAQIVGAVNVAATTTSANPMLRLELRIGNFGNTPDAVSKNINSLEYRWDTTTTPPPPKQSYLRVTAIDVNHNRAETIINFTTTTTAAESLSAPQNALVHSFTYPYAQRKSRDGELRAAPQGASIYNQINWDRVSGASGYRVYRKGASSEEFIWLGDKMGGNGELFVDYDPALSPGETRIYAVTAFGSKGESPKSETPGVTLLGRFAVTLQSPEDGDVAVPTSPTFTWSVGQSAGVEQEYTLEIIGYNDISPFFRETVNNETSFSGAVLDKNRFYEWNLTSAVALGSWNDAADDFLARSFGQVEGSHVFTTGE